MFLIKPAKYTVCIQKQRLHKLQLLLKNALDYKKQKY